MPGLTRNVKYRLLQMAIIDARSVNVVGRRKSVKLATGGGV